GLAALSTTGIVQRTGPGTYIAAPTVTPTDVIFATAGQSIINLTNVTSTSRFPAGTLSYIQVFLNGIQQREDNSTGTAYGTPGSFYVSGAAQITFFASLSLGDEVTVYQL
ncbi:MAG: hypothetical protein KGI25_08920, partial [Thaumarchaeota archaeon]|nr:hypothetical protein [Nitrososphaerota archaeon]